MRAGTLAQEILQPPEAAAGKDRAFRRNCHIRSPSVGGGRHSRRSIWDAYCSRTRQKRKYGRTSRARELQPAALNWTPDRRHPLQSQRIALAVSHPEIGAGTPATTVL